MACAQKYKGPPELICVILPEGGNDIYTAVKQYVGCSSLLIIADLVSEIIASAM
jgi:hypothetical protein